MLNWTEGHDDDDNSTWVASSCLWDGPDGSPFEWRIEQRLRGNKIVWVDDASAGELRCDETEEFATCELAKAHCQETEDGIIAGFGGTQE